MFRNRPAFVLGLGPDLPADLSALHDQFTIGVNDIQSTGFVPTILMFVDGCQVRHIARDTGVLVICDRGVAQRPGDIGLDIALGGAAWRSEATPLRLHCNGSTGVMAARWALALGCYPVYLLALSGKRVGYRTSCLPGRKPHSDNAMALFAAEAGRLHDAYPDRVQWVCPYADLSVLCGEPLDQAIARAAVRRRLMHGN